jgi:hypothetical protein
LVRKHQLEQSDLDAQASLEQSDWSAATLTRKRHSNEAPQKQGNSTETGARGGRRAVVVQITAVVAFETVSADVLLLWWRR